jgi:hypothetical protein
MSSGEELNGQYCLIEPVRKWMFQAGQSGFQNDGRYVGICHSKIAWIILRKKI